MNKQELVEGWARKLSAPDLKRPEDFKDKWVSTMKQVGISPMIVSAARPEELELGIRGANRSILILYPPNIPEDKYAILRELGISAVESVPTIPQPKLDLKSLLPKQGLHIGPVESGQEKRRKRRKRLNKK